MKAAVAERQGVADARSGRAGLRGSARRVRAQLRRTRRDRRRRRRLLARREGRRPVGRPPHARRATRRGTRTRWSSCMSTHQGPRGDDAGGGERARLARLRRAGRALLARVRPERQGRDHRAPAPRPRGRARLARREAARREAARPRLRRARARAAEAGVAAGDAPRLPRDDDRPVHAGADPPRGSRRTARSGGSSTRRSRVPLGLEFYIGLPREIPDERLAKLKTLVARARPAGAAAIRRSR